MSIQNISRSQKWNNKRKISKTLLWYWWTKSKILLRYNPKEGGKKKKETQRDYFQRSYFPFPELNKSSKNRNLYLYLLKRLGSLGALAGRTVLVLQWILDLQFHRRLVRTIRRFRFGPEIRRFHQLNHQRKQFLVDERNPESQETNRRDDEKAREKTLERSDRIGEIGGDSETLEDKSWEIERDRERGNIAEKKKKKKGKRKRLFRMGENLIKQRKSGYN